MGKLVAAGGSGVGVTGSESGSGVEPGKGVGSMDIKRNKSLLPLVHGSYLVDVQSQAPQLKELVRNG